MTKLLRVQFPHNKKDFRRSLVNGASDGIGLEPYYIEFAEMAIHESELVEQVCKFLCLMNK